VNVGRVFRARLEVGALANLARSFFFATVGDNFCLGRHDLRWRPGDRNFFIGFSRGAYTVRRLAGIMCRCGIPTIPIVTGMLP
jgi:hypothetical protein